jgi:hypothetical protein
MANIEAHPDSREPVIVVSKLPLDAMDTNDICQKEWASRCREWVEYTNTFSLPRGKDSSDEKLDSGE